MSEKHPTLGEIESGRNEPVTLPLDPEAALRGFLAVDPDAELADHDDEPSDRRPPPKASR